VEIIMKHLLTVGAFLFLAAPAQAQSEYCAPEGEAPAWQEFSYERAGNGDLRCTDLRGADLTETPPFNGFNDMDLSYSNLAGVVAEGVSFLRANLTGVNLANANLRNADLGGADLTDANLTDAEFEGARYTNATVWPAGGVPEGAVEYKY
jgi:uncharacterized protein YjbI with pentapeptide repeats